MKRFFTLFLAASTVLLFTGNSELPAVGGHPDAMQKSLARKVGGKKTRLQYQQRKQYQNQNPASRVA